MKNLSLIFTLFLLIASTDTIYAQADTLTPSKDKYKVVKNDGAIYVGHLLKNDAREVLIRTESIGDVYIPKHEIMSIEKFDPVEVDIEEKEKNRHLLPSRYLQSSNALPVKKGEGYGKVMILGMDFEFAITDNWSMGGMVSWVGAPAVFKTKYCFNLGEKLNTSLGFIYGNTIYSGFVSYGDAFSDGAGLFQGNITFGDEEANINIGAGYGFTHFERYFYEETVDQFGNVYYNSGRRVQTNGMSLFTISAMKRVSKQAMLIFDSAISINYYSTFAVFAPAVRYMPSQQNIFQFGLGMGVFDGDFYPLPLPMVSYHRVFKKN